MSYQSETISEDLLQNQGEQYSESLYDPLCPRIVSDTNGFYTDPTTMAHDIVCNTGTNLFLTGKAGTGKTTFLKNLTKDCIKRLVVLAPTGVAAINAGGTTIHSFFQLSFSPYIPGVGYADENNRRYNFNKVKRSIIRTLDLLVIDEISMVRPDVLDAVDGVLRRLRNPLKPFGGLQLLMIGDLRQLAPVAQSSEWEILSTHYSNPYFFESKALQEAGFVTIELSKVFRQQDSIFINILNRIRENNVDLSTLELLNRRAIPGIIPADDKGIIRLTSHNHYAETINKKKLSDINEEECLYTAKITGNFPESLYPADSMLTLKKGAQVMFIKNDPQPEKRYYNGLIGTVTAYTSGTVTVKTDETPSRQITVEPIEWNNTSYSLDEVTGKIVEVVEGTFSQIPLRTAWAITIHKSQGLTFEKAIIDVSKAFAPGQTYVALSRCRSLDGIYLSSPLSYNAIMTDPAVNNFIHTQQENVPDSIAIDHFKRCYHESLLLELFDFGEIIIAMDSLDHALTNDVVKNYPKFTSVISEHITAFRNEILPVAGKLISLIRTFFHVPSSAAEIDPDRYAILSEKIKGGCKYFSEKLIPIENILKIIPTNFDNKATASRLKKNGEELLNRISLRISLLSVFKNTDFSVDTYLNKKASILLSFESGTSFRARTQGKRKGHPVIEANLKFPDSENSGSGSDLTEDIVNPELYEYLRKWRNYEAIDIEKPAFVVLSNRTLMQIATVEPATIEALAQIVGMGKTKIKKYGKTILNLINEYRQFRNDNSQLE